MRRKPIYPNDQAFPPRMMAAMAAAYVGEQDVPAFLERVKLGKYPAPYLIESHKRKWWLRKELDVAMGLVPDYEDETMVEASLGDKFRASKIRRGQSGTA